MTTPNFIKFGYELAPPWGKRRYGSAFIGILYMSPASVEAQAYGISSTWLAGDENTPIDALSELVLSKGLSACSSDKEKLLAHSNNSSSLHRAKWWDGCQAELNLFLEAEWTKIITPEYSTASYIDLKGPILPANWKAHFLTVSKLSADSPNPESVNNNTIGVNAVVGYFRVGNPLSKEVTIGTKRITDKWRYPNEYCRCNYLVKKEIELKTPEIGTLTDIEFLLTVVRYDWNNYATNPRGLSSEVGQIANLCANALTAFDAFDGQPNGITWAGQSTVTLIDSVQRAAVSGRGYGFVTDGGPPSNIEMTSGSDYVYDRDTLIWVFSFENGVVEEVAAMCENFRMYIGVTAGPDDEAEFQVSVFSPDGIESTYVTSADQEVLEFNSLIWSNKKLYLNGNELALSSASTSVLSGPSVPEVGDYDFSVTTVDNIITHGFAVLKKSFTSSQVIDLHRAITQTSTVYRGELGYIGNVQTRGL